MPNEYKTHFRLQPLTRLGFALLLDVGEHSCTMPKRKDEEGHETSEPKRAKLGAEGRWADDASITEHEQVSMRTVWAMYAAALETGDGGEGSIYDLVRSVTAAEEQEADEPRFDNISPLVALARAKDTFALLPAAEQKASPCFGNKWCWSPQSTAAGKQLQSLYGDVAWDVDSLLSDYDNVFRAGWRWYPAPAVKKKSHDHRFYPPKNLLCRVEAWQLAVKKAKHIDKNGLGAGATYLTSTETSLFLKWNATEHG